MLTWIGILGKRKFKCSYQESNLRPSDDYFVLDALPLSYMYRRLVGAKGIKLGSFIWLIVIIIIIIIIIIDLFIFVVGDFF